MKCTEPFVIIDYHIPTSIVADSPATDVNRFFYIDVHEYRGFAIKLKSTLDQAVTLTIYGNFERATVGADDYADTLTLAAGNVTTQYGIIVFHTNRTAWTPWIYCSTVTAGVPDSAGRIFAEIIKFDPMQD